MSYRDLIYSGVLGERDTSVHPRVPLGSSMEHSLRFLLIVLTATELAEDVKCNNMLKRVLLKKTIPSFSRRKIHSAIIVVGGFRKISEILNHNGKFERRISARNFGTRGIENINFVRKFSSTHIIKNRTSVTLM